MNSKDDNNQPNASAQMKEGARTWYVIFNRHQYGRREVFFHVTAEDARSAAVIAARRLLLEGTRPACIRMGKFPRYGFKIVMIESRDRLHGEPVVGHSYGVETDGRGRLSGQVITMLPPIVLPIWERQQPEGRVEHPLSRAS